MPPEVLKCLHDAAQACELLQHFTAGKSLADYKNDALLRSAVERQFIIVGEALQQAVRIMPELTSSISEVRRIINFRNVIVHGYAQLVSDTVWGVVEKDLPILSDKVKNLLAKAASEQSPP